MLYLHEDYLSHDMNLNLKSIVRLATPREVWFSVFRYSYVMAGVSYFIEVLDRLTRR